MTLAARFHFCPCPASTSARVAITLRIAVLLLLVPLLNCLRNLQASLEKAVHDGDGQKVEALLNRGADAFSDRGPNPSIFKLAVFEALDDSMLHGTDSPRNPAYQALCRKYRSRYPAVDAKLPLQVGVMFLGLSSAGANLVPVVSSNYQGKNVKIEFGRDETEFRKITTYRDGYVIKLPPGEYNIKGRLIEDSIEAESAEFLGSPDDMEKGMSIPLSRFLRSTVKVHEDFSPEYLVWLAKTKGGTTQGPDKKP
jgi:hypothetical protein